MSSGGIDAAKGYVVSFIYSKLELILRFHKHALPKSLVRPSTVYKDQNDSFHKTALFTSLYRESIKESQAAVLTVELNYQSLP